MSESSGVVASGSRDDRYRIVVVPTGLELYEWDDGVWERENLDANETLAPVAGSDRFALRELYRSFIEVKILAPTQDPADPADVYVIVNSYYTNLQGVRVQDSSGGSGDGSDDDDDDSSDDSGSGGGSGDDSDDDSSDDEDDVCEGDSRGNVLSGFRGRDLLKGYGGSDRLSGGDDDDDLDGGDDDDDLYGDDGHDVLTGGRGRDRADGGRGDDLFLAGEDEDDDHYIGGDGLDAVTYSGAAAGVVVDLQTGKAQSRGGLDAAAIGRDRLQSVERVIGSEFDDDLIGSVRSDILDGAGGDDRLDGRRGADRCTGGIGADRFVVSKASDTGLGQRADLITDFSAVEGDQLDLSAIDARKGFSKNDAFVFTGAAPTRSGLDSLGVVWFDDGYLYASTDKDVDPEFAVQVFFKDAGVTGLNAGDIVL